MLILAFCIFFQLFFCIFPLNITIDTNSPSPLFINQSFVIFSSLDEALSNIANNSDLSFKIQFSNTSSNKNLSITLGIVQITKNVTISSNPELLGIGISFSNTQILINRLESKFILCNLNISIITEDLSFLFQVKGGGTLVIKVINLIIKFTKKK